MYGVIYIAIKDYSEAALGNEKWNELVAQSGVDVDFTLTEQPYNDDISFTLAQCYADMTGVPLQQVLFDLGRQVIRTTNSKFKPIISSRGETLYDYLLNLPNFHNRISLIYPELKAPEFRITDVEPTSMVLRYRKKREGMTSYFEGYVHGLAEVFNENVTIAPVTPAGSTEEVYKITW